VVANAGAVPVVYVFSADPILAGIAQSLARPGGNATGISLLSVELNGKRIELLREMLPRLERVTVLANPAHSGANFELEACDNAGRQLGIAVRQVLVRNAAELEESFAEIAAGKPGAITVIPDGLVIQKRQRIVDFAAKERIPVISGWKIFAESGALCTYGPRLTESYRRAGFYIDRILKGATPAELPIERPTVFELVVTSRPPRAWASFRPSGSRAPRRLTNESGLPIAADERQGARRGSARCATASAPRSRASKTSMQARVPPSCRRAGSSAAIGSGRGAAAA
jgi:ABC-type uncharacterized transport system substrate-binding protein